jgi:hypothetical protein
LDGVLHSKRQEVVATLPKEQPKTENKDQKSELYWLEVEDEPDELFLEKLANCTLDSWDHRTHLRIAWTMLKKYGRREGMKKIFDAISHFIQNSPRASKTTFHETMTYFWVHMVPNRSI